ncbi:unnamed protein product [Nippostrongylus brasiliensis]|uniref:Astacin domain-containing protein n=1 Tax=Nippostrongylus brasiliensis TaxID=27835 RepID=A0A0N4YAH1_NIPBR|nr:unnamed protein product [Nippostrongylus brasiliensis]
MVLKAKFTLTQCCLSDAGMKTTIKTALNYIQARTCLKFTESSTATQRESLVHNYIKMEPSEEIVYTPYEYGSVMHYDAKSFANSGNSMIATDGRYMRTMGSNMVTFYDLQEINKHYNCTCTKLITQALTTGISFPRMEAGYYAGELTVETGLAITG